MISRVKTGVLVLFFLSQLEMLSIFNGLGSPFQTYKRRTKTFAVELGSQDLDFGSLVIQTQIGSMGHSLLLLHDLIKCPEINRLFASCYLHHFKVFPCFFHARFTTILPLTLNGALD